jgi:hypothetical protein
MGFGIGEVCFQDNIRVTTAALEIYPESFTGVRVFFYGTDELKSRSAILRLYQFETIG